MLYSIAADALVVLHLAFIAFVLLGGLLVLRWRRALYLHLPAVVWGILVELQGWLCPLTPLEQHFRLLAGDAGYRGSFIQHYLLPVIYPDGLTRDIQLLLGIAVIAANLLIYTAVFAARRHGRGRE